MQIHVLSFEGPDAYSRAGGIASRISGLAESLAEMGYETHLWFVGDPALPGHESRGSLHLHRWCQWISTYHPSGVYDGEHGKCIDYASSLPPYLMQEHLLPHLSQGGRAVVLAEEWHTADAVLHLDWLLKSTGLRSNVEMFWNANNTFGFDLIDWGRLRDAAIVTTVSRYMKHWMQPLGVDALVIPNGISADAFESPARPAVHQFRQHLDGRMVLAKVARFDPDKRWLLAVDIVAELKKRGRRPLLVARGGMEGHGHDVLTRATARGLRVVERASDRPGEEGLLECVRDVQQADFLYLRSAIDAGSRRLLFRESSAVLANSSHEPFGLVGLETMAVGGVACTGYSGEDYAIAGRNAVVLQTGDTQECVESLERLRSHPDEEQTLRRQARVTARHYLWPEIIQRNFVPRLGVVRGLGSEE